MFHKLLRGKMLAMFVVLLLLCVTVAVAEEEQTDAKGTWRYVVADGGATITGYEKAPKGKLTIPDELDGHPVVGIGAEALSFCAITSVTIPNSVTDIGEWAFKECDRLTKVTMGSGVTSIGEMAFFACDALKSVTIPGKVRRIGAYAFAHCDALTSVTLPASVKYIGERAFVIFDEEADYGLVLNKRIKFRVKKGSYADQYVQRGCTTYPPPYEASELLPFDQYTMKLTIDNKVTVNIRNGPGTEYAQIGEAYPGAHFYYTGVTKNGFHEIVFPGLKSNPDVTADEVILFDDLYIAAFVMESLGAISPITEEDVLLSSVIGILVAEDDAKIFYDEQRKKPSKATFSYAAEVPFAGVLPDGTYAVLFMRENDLWEQILWIGYIAEGDVIAESGL